MRLEDYALIGDLHTAALVSRTGSIDWLCLPRFDSAACFAALLGTPEHGRWLIAPAVPTRSARRRYRGDSLLLETALVTDGGAVRLIDCMPPRGDAPQVVRLVEGVRGEVPMTMELVIRFDYGSVVPWVRSIDGVLRTIAGPDALSLRTPVATHGVGFTTKAEFTVRAGERVPFVATWHPSNREAPGPVDAVAVTAETEQWWREWSSRCTYRGPWRDDVLRSMIALKALVYAPTGGIVAAPTTSLPEQIGGVRNWDYRFCWLRDATFSLYALMNGGYLEEAAAWRDWLLRAVAGEPSKLQVVYGPAGERRIDEIELPWLPGYEGSSPVRTGNAAYRQRQTDVYGELMDVFHVARRSGLPDNPDGWRLQVAIIEFLESAWREPGNGIWEMRGPPRDFTHSKVMAWVAFDRAIRAVEQFGREGPIERWREQRLILHEEICTRGYDARRNTFTQSYDGSELDASLLLIPLVGFLPIDDPRVRGTIAAIEAELVEDGLVRRYRTSGEVDGLPEGEAMFLPCTFWLADNYALAGREGEARRLFERLLALANDVGLLAEEYDPRDGRLLGNFPQAFSHVSLINTAQNLSREQGPAEHRPGR